MDTKRLLKKRDKKEKKKLAKEQQLKEDSSDEEVQAPKVVEKQDSDSSDAEVEDKRDNVTLKPTSSIVAETSKGKEEKETESKCQYIDNNF